MMGRTTIFRAAPALAARALCAALMLACLFALLPAARAAEPNADSSD